MTNKEYATTYEAYSKRLSELQNKQIDLESELDDVTKEVAALEGIVKFLAPLAGQNLEEDITALGITNAVRSVLDRKDRRSANDVKQKLMEAGFDLSAYSAPDQTIRKILARLVEAGKAAPEKEGWKIYYKFKMHPDDVTDEDIPF